MILQNGKGIKVFPYITRLNSNKKIYYGCDPKRLPHQGLRERQRRIRQAMRIAVKCKDRTEAFTQLAYLGAVA